MDNVHFVFTRLDSEFDDEVGASVAESQAPFIENRDAQVGRSVSPQYLIPGTGDADSRHYAVATHDVPVPIDILIAIGEHVAVQDLPRFFAANRRINTLYREDRIGYAKSLSKIGSALRLSEIVTALSAITQYGAGKQPYLLRALAQNIRVQTHGPAYGAMTEWQGVIDAQFDFHTGQPPGSERERALQQLIIARGCAFTESHFSRSGEPLRSIIGDRMSKLAFDYWPAVFEAFLSDGDIGDLLRACKFKEVFTGSIPSISPAFGLLLAFEFLRPPHDNADVGALLRDRLGVSEAYIRQTLDPLVAIGMANMAKRQSAHLRNAWLMKAIRLWRRDDCYFASLATDAFVKSFDAEVFRQRSFSCLLNQDFADLPELEHKVRERTILLESPTIIALRDTENNAEDQIDAFLNMIDRIGDSPSGTTFRTVLRDIVGLPHVYVGVPMVARPALLHRLVATAQIGWNDRHTADIFISAAIECRNTLIAADTNHSPLISRVSAALILVTIALRKYDTSAADAIVSEASDVAFLRVAREDWGDVLQALIYECTLGRPLSAKKWERIDKQTALFVCLPNVSICHLPDLTNRIGKIAGSVWRQLPDKADSVGSRFDVFKRRVGILAGMGEIALESIAKSLVPDVVAGVHFLENVAAESGFDDPDAIAALETALFDFKIRSLLHPDSDVDVVTNQYTKRSLYLRSLIERGVHNLRMLSDVENAVT